MATIDCKRNTISEATSDNGFDGIQEEEPETFSNLNVYSETENVK